MTRGEDEAAAGGPSRRLAQVSTAVGLLVGGLTTAFVVRTLLREWDRVEDSLADASWAWMAAGLVAASLAMTTIAWAWGGVLRNLEHERVPARRVIAWYYVGELGKYLPGGLWPVVGRGELARRGGVPRSRAYASVALSLGLLYLAAMGVGLAALPFAIAAGGSAGAPVLLLLLLPVGVFALHPRVLEPALALVRRVTRRELAVAVPSWRSSLVAIARYVPVWLLVGVATWSVARAVSPDPPVAQVVFAAALSWTAGFLAVPVPAGAGVREAVFIAASGLDPGIAATVAVATRVLFILADAGGAAVSAPWLRRRAELAAGAGRPGARRGGDRGRGLDVAAGRATPGSSGPAA